MKLKSEEAKEMIGKLIAEMEEEDIGVSLFATFCQSEDELAFFSEGDRGRVMAILKRLSDDSRRHKQILEKLIDLLGEKVK